MLAFELLYAECHKPRARPVSQGLFILVYLLRAKNYLEKYFLTRLPLYGPTLRAGSPFIGQTARGILRRRRWLTSRCRMPFITYATHAQKSRAIVVNNNFRRYPSHVGRIAAASACAQCRRASMPC